MKTNNEKELEALLLTQEAAYKELLDKYVKEKETVRWMHEFIRRYLIQLNDGNSYKIIQPKNITNKMHALLLEIVLKIIK